MPRLRQHARHVCPKWDRDRVESCGLGDDGRASTPDPRPATGAAGTTTDQSSSGRRSAGGRLGSSDSGRRGRHRHAAYQPGHVNIDRRAGHVKSCLNRSRRGRNRSGLHRRAAGIVAADNDFDRAIDDGTSNSASSPLSVCSGIRKPWCHRALCNDPYRLRRPTRASKTSLKPESLTNRHRQPNPLPHELPVIRGAGSQAVDG